MTGMMKFLRSALLDDTATMAIETAIVAPVLALMALGGFEASALVARKSELESAAAEAAAIVSAAPPADATERAIIKTVVQTSIDPNDLDPYDVVTVTEIYRCGTSAYVTVKPTCATSAELSTYVELKITDRYVPKWTGFGIGSPVDYLVLRRVLVA